MFWLLITLAQMGQFKSSGSRNTMCGALLVAARGGAIVAGISLAFSTAAAEERFHLIIDSQVIETAINYISEQTNYQFIYTDPDIAATATREVNGRMTVAEALSIMLANTGVAFQYLNNNTIRLYKAKSKQIANKKVAETTRSALPRPNTSMEEIEVVGAPEQQSRYLTSQDVVTIGTLNTRDLEERSISNFQDLGLAVPGMSVQDTGGLHRRVFVRGVGNWAGSSSLIGIYLDEATITANPAFQLDLRPYDMERIEVLRGAQNGSYGDGSVGGTIRFVTKKPNLERFEAGIDLSAAFTHEGEPGQKLQGVLNLPIISDTAGLRIAAIFDRSGGWIDQPAAQRSDFNDQNAKTVYVKGLWQASDTVSAHSLVLLHRNVVASNIGEDENGNYEQVFNLLTYPTVEDRFNLYSLNLSWNTGLFNLVSSTSYLDAFKRSQQLSNRDPVLPPPALPIPKLFVDYPTDTSVFNQELRLTSNQSGRWSWAVGGFYRDASLYQSGLSQYLIPGDTELTNVNFRILESTRSWSLFADTEFSVSDRCGLGIGFRYYHDNRKYFDDFTYQSGTFGSVNPRAYAHFDITDTFRIYGNIVKGFRSGGFNLFGIEPYRPDSLWSYDIGVKTARNDDSLSAEMTLFYSDYRDYQVVNTLPLPAPQLFVQSNVGDGEIKGVDWSILWQPRKNFRLGLSGNYVGTRFVRINKDATTHMLGDRLDLVPEYGVTLSASYHFKFRNRPAFVRLDYDQQGRSVLRNRSKGEHYTGSSDVINMLGLQAEWQWHNKLSLGIFVKNLLNDRGYVDAFALIARAARPRPRTIGVKISAEF